MDTDKTSYEKPAENPLAKLIIEVRNQIITPLIIVTAGKISDKRKQYLQSGNMAKQAVGGIVFNPLHKWFGKVIPGLVKKANNG